MFRIPSTVPKLVTRGRTLKSTTRHLKTGCAAFCQDSNTAPKPKSGKGLKLFVLAVAGGTLGYVLYDNKIRGRIESEVPYAKETFDALFSYLPPPKDRNSTPLVPPIHDQETIPVPEIEKKEDSVIAEPQKTKKELELEKKRLEKQEAERLLKEREESEAFQNKKMEESLQNLFFSVSKTVESAVAAGVDATEAVKQHTQKLKLALETSDAKEGEWEAVIDAHSDRNEAVLAFESLSSKAKSDLEEVRTLIAKGRNDKVTKKNKVLYSIEDKINKLNQSLNSATKEFSKARSDAKVFSEYRHLVKKGKEQFKKELESILPEINKITSPLNKLTEDELNALIAHAHRRIDQLQKQLAEQLSLEKLRLEEALHKQREADASLHLVSLSQEKELWKNELEHIKSAWDMESHVNFEQELKLQLTRQAAAHSDHITEVLKIQQREMEAKFSVLLSEEIEKERREFQRQVANWVARLHGIEEAIDKRAELEKQGHKVQKLWLACESLQTAINSGKLGAKDWQSRVKPLEDEISLVREAADGQPAIIAILDAIPKEAVDRGVWTESALIERFKKVSKVCKQVAMIDETTSAGGNIFKYALSFLQSKFIISGASKIYESSDEEVDIEELKNTFVLIDNAQACLKKGDFVQAVRFVNQLSGEPKLAASDWLAEARLLLETKQISAALLASASAAGFTSAAGTS